MAINLLVKKVEKGVVVDKDKGKGKVKDDIGDNLL